MKHIKLFSILTVLILLACSNNDEPETEYTGSWEICYIENYYGLHNNSSEFNQWFAQHKDCFDEAWFSSVNGHIVFTLSASNGGSLESEYYSQYYIGDIVWLETVNNATEDDIKRKVSYFEAFSITNDKNKTSDKFSAQYRKLK